MSHTLSDIHLYQPPLQALEQDIHRLHESMSLLRNLIQDQQPQLDSIEDSIHHSKEQAQSAHEDLLQAEEYQASTTTTNRLLYLAGMALAGIAYLLL